MTTAIFSRAPGIRARRLDDDVFLVAEDETIFHLNAVGGAVWTLLERPARESEIIEVLSHAFPDVAEDTIRADVGALLSRLAAGGLVVQERS